MKLFLTILAAFTFLTTNAQLDQVKFKEGTFENGMLYPIAVISKNPAIADKINKHLQEQIKDLKDADFCIGQYGYVQKGAHLQIHIFCNCIDFDESQNRYYLYNIETGDHVDYVDIFNPKKVKVATEDILAQTKQFAASNNITLSDADINAIKTSNLDAFKVIFKRDGMDLWLNSESWGDKAMFIKWSALREVMKFSFI